MIRLLAATLEQVGEMRLKEGKPEAALAEFLEQYRVLRNLGPQSSDEKLTAVPLAFACEKIGVALTALGKVREALPRFQEEIKILQPLADREPDNLSLRRAYSVALEKLGGALLSLGRAKESREFLEKRLHISEILVLIDPRSVAFRRDLAIAHHRLASAWMADRELGKALVHCRADKELSAELVTEFPLHKGLLLDLAGAQFQLAIVLMGIGSEKTEWRANLARSSDILDRLKKDGPLDEPGRLLDAQVIKVVADSLPPQIGPKR